MGKLNLILPNYILLLKGVKDKITTFIEYQKDFSFVYELSPTSQET